MMLHGMKRMVFLIAMMIMMSGVMAMEVMGEWGPVGLKMKTPWTDQVNVKSVLREYPRPQMVRGEWANHNGLWEYAITSKDAGSPEKYEGEILVPFCIESALSGVGKTVKHDEALWYRRALKIAKPSDGKRVLLHFGAVDWIAKVAVNGKRVGSHKGGFTPFSFDITDALVDGEKQVVTVRVLDPTSDGYQPRGKQISNPHGIWYTSVTGIWQTVWSEVVPSSYIERLRITPDIDNGTVTIQTTTQGDAGEVEVTVLKGEEVVGVKRGVVNEVLTLAVKDARLWSPEDPFLYGLKVTFKQGAVKDEVSSYFGMRKIERRKGKDGYQRMYLNNKAVFQFGPLDQGWWPDGLYTAPTDEALKYDIEMTLKFGFNMARKHVKVEPARWYYWADKLGLLVWQDMPNGDQHIGPDSKADFVRSAESQANFEREWKEIMDSLYNYPCIVVWVPFNEGWGQSDSSRMIRWTQGHDTTRLVGGPSGWADRGVGDLHDMHKYPGPGMFDAGPDRVSVLGEYGGLGLPLEGHLWQNKQNWGYRTYKTKDELWYHYQLLTHELPGLIGRGLAAAVYTQTTDVEGEVNGLMTYDRQVIKFDVKQLHDLNRIVFLPPPVTKVLLPTADMTKNAGVWKYRFEKPEGEWFGVKYDDKGWKSGQAGFGSGEPRNTVANTKWTGSDVWIRRTFELEAAVEGKVYLRVFHDEDTEIYINGIKAGSLTGYSTDYIKLMLRDDVVKSLKAKGNTIAIHCKQTRGGQYIDAGLIAEVPAKK